MPSSFLTVPSVLIIFLHGIVNVGIVMHVWKIYLDDLAVVCRRYYQGIVIYHLGLPAVAVGFL
ncbi:MAG: hypothetical protein QXM16_00275 [Nitrososphaerota archaeon]